MVINDTRYDQDILESQILTQESIGDNLKHLEIIKLNLNDIPKRNIDLNNDEFASLDDASKETKSKYRSRIPKNHRISNVIGNVNEQVVTRRQSRLNEIGLVCYTS